MRTITTDLYRYFELSDEAKKYAVEHMRERCFCDNADWIWDDAGGTIDTVKEIADVKVSIQESSQGFYVDYHHDNNWCSDDSDEERFEQFRKNYVEQFKEMLWCDNKMLEIVKNYVPDERRSYSSNIGWMLVKFCEFIYDCSLDYYDDDNVSAWLTDQDFEFREDGRLYHE